MEISPRKPSKRAQEPVDEWLQNEGYFRKHAPRDPTCLFRAVSEQVYLTQYYHIRVRKECVEFMGKMRDLFVEAVTVPFDNYLEQMSCFTEWGGMNEIQAMSLLYKREFVIFNGQKQTLRTVTDNGFTEKIYICHTPQKQYESIYTSDFIASAAYCQSLVYQILYKDVFEMSNVNTTVHKMLHDRSATFRHDKFFQKGNLEIRDQLTMEIYNRIVDGTEETEAAKLTEPTEPTEPSESSEPTGDLQSVSKGVPPFPYRVAKALDPNIYRNTDFDIWHEIRREVKNAGWTRHNSHELQVGGKCMVQIDFNEGEFDKANNNSNYMCRIEKDPNGNDLKMIQKKCKQDSVFFCGHIQEMGKNQGPVLVFIEELGEKRTVPYSALKPLPLRKNKQSNWLPVYKRNAIVDPNQKWKKPCATSTRKTKESINTLSILSSNTDKNGNNANNAANVNGNNKYNYQDNQWNDEASEVDNEPTFDKYVVERNSDHLSTNSAEIFSGPNMLDNSQSPMMDNAKPEVTKECIGKQLPLTNHARDDVNKGPKSAPQMNSESNSQGILANASAFCVGPDGNSYPLFPCTSENVGDSVCLPTNQMDRMLRSINCSVEKSVDVHCSDLPLSDPFTLRFFYNLGLEYFRVNHNNWNYPLNGQPVGFGSWYQGNLPTDEEVASITNGVMQDCTLVPQKGEHDNDRRENNTRPLYPENAKKCVDGIKDTQYHKTENHRGEGTRESLYSPREKIKEQSTGTKDFQRTARNGLAPRFKKNSDNRYRNGYQQSHTHQQQMNNSNHYQHRGPMTNSPKPQDTKFESINSQYPNSAPHQVHVPTGSGNSYHTPYVQQGYYSGLPFYASEADPFGSPYYTPNPGFFSFPCVPHSDIPENNNNVAPFAPHIYPGVDYAQAYPGLCPPYVCAQPASYNMPQQGVPEHYMYALPGQPHYMQYAPMVPLTADGACNIVGQNATQSASS